MFSSIRTVFQNRRVYGFCEIIKITLPLIFSALSSNLMLIIDRFIVGYISIQSMNALAIAGSYIGVVTSFFISITTISAVFVGRHNGDKTYDQIGIPVWQMLYFSGIIFLVSIPFGLNPEMICFLPNTYHDLGIGYQQILTYFIWVPAAYCAVSGFFIGLGKTALVTAVVIFSNILNFVLDIIFVFGIEGIVPQYGVTGAAIATVVSNFIGLLILFVIFINKRNREHYGTGNIAFNRRVFKECIKVGSPLAFDRVFNLGIWSVIFVLLGRVSDDLATLENITVSLLILLSCYSEGLNKSSAAIAANIIGAKKTFELNRILKTYILLNICFGILISIPLGFYNSIILKFINALNGNVEHLQGDFQFIFYALIAIIFFDGIVKTLEGIFAAGGNTLFPALLNSVLEFSIVGIPAFYMYYRGTLDSIYEINYCSIAMSAIAAIILYMKYRRFKWIKRIV